VTTNQTDLRTSDFDYELPDALIAQHPLPRRDASRLLCLDRATGAVDHRVFADIDALLRPGDLLVLNDTRVLPARLFCRSASGARIELLFTRRLDPARWLAIGRPGKRIKPGALLHAEQDGEVVLCIEESYPDGSRLVRFAQSPREGSIDEALERLGRIPLPPYVRRPATARDREQYQTVYARTPGAVAAPTAGLHFTPALLQRLIDAGVGTARVTLHVGIGTFRPVKEDDPRNHPMHAEAYSLSPETVAAIRTTRLAGKRVVAVGTTVVRVLEHCARADGSFAEGEGMTRLMILPGHRFRAIDALITNFHLPKSTLLMLVSAFAGRDPVLRAYQEAVAREYRFFSFGDAMFIG
jgi:S-adenosylmethionine:tRNA ribosyltransferase-isomerase